MRIDDLYNQLIKKYGKVKVWNSNPDVVCDMIEEMLKVKNKYKVINGDIRISNGPTTPDPEDN